jgi:hypothetical protein
LLLITTGKRHYELSRNVVTTICVSYRSYFFFFHYYFSKFILKIMRRKKTRVVRFAKIDHLVRNHVRKSHLKKKKAELSTRQWKCIWLRLVVKKCGKKIEVHDKNRHQVWIWIKMLKNKNKKSKLHFHQHQSPQWRYLWQKIKHTNLTQHV